MTVLAADSGRMLDQRALTQPTPMATEPTRKVLLVDDDVTSHRLLGASLRAAGFEVQAAHDGAEALKTIEGAPPDVLVLDFDMPGLNGAEVCRRLRDSEQPALTQLPVIMLTGHAGETEEIACLTAGANDFVTKPVSRAVLIARIETQLRLAALSDALRAQNEELSRWRTVQEADLGLARATQQAIVAPVLPKIEGWTVEAIYTPLIQVGGDVHGWRQLDKNRWLFWQADATGHGVAAALFTTLIALLFSHASTAARSAEGILMRVNQEFCGMLRGRAFLTACCAVVERDGRFSFAGAGHPPLIIRRASGSVEALPSQSTMVGIDKDMTIEETQTTLAPGEAALLYTDGLYSLKTSAGVRFEPEAVGEACAALRNEPEMLTSLIEQLVKRSNGEPFEDDVAAIALRRR